MSLFFCQKPRASVFVQNTLQNLIHPRTVETFIFLLIDCATSACVTLLPDKNILLAPGGSTKVSTVRQWINFWTENHCRRQKANLVAILEGASMVIQVSTQQFWQRIGVTLSIYTTSFLWLAIGGDSMRACVFASSPPPQEPIKWWKNTPRERADSSYNEQDLNFQTFI